MSIEVVGSFCQSQDGKQLMGNLDVTRLKRLRRKEVEVVLMRAADLPDGLARLAQRSDIDPSAFLVFSVARKEESDAPDAARSASAD